MNANTDSLRIHQTARSTPAQTETLLSAIETECRPLGAQRADWARKMMTMQHDLLELAVRSAVLAFPGAVPTWATVHRAYTAQLDRRSQGLL